MAEQTVAVGRRARAWLRTSSSFLQYQTFKAKRLKSLGSLDIPSKQGGFEARVHGYVDTG